MSGSTVAVKDLLAVDLKTISRAARCQFNFKGGEFFKEKQYKIVQ